MSRNGNSHSNIIKLLLWNLIVLKTTKWLNCDFHYYVADWSIGVIHFDWFIWMVYSHSVSNSYSLQCYHCITVWTIGYKRIRGFTCANSEATDQIMSGLQFYFIRSEWLQVLIHYYEKCIILWGFQAVRMM